MFRVAEVARDFLNDIDGGFPARFRFLREAKGISKKELSEKLGISQRLVNLYETGANAPGGKILRRIAIYFDVPADYLLGLPDERKETLCWSCAKYCGGCSWSRTFTPVKGWLATKRIAWRKQQPREPAAKCVSYTVIACPEFVSDRRGRP